MGWDPGPCDTSGGFFTAVVLLRRWLFYGGGVFPQHGPLWGLVQPGKKRVCEIYSKKLSSCVLPWAGLVRSN